ncbi:hypothetical protein A9Q76_04050 [Arcobacter sp. 31_11_sub10_T18]|nr:hypothetical protein A9Q76_04050 [Arcobacter sp. 31_11_sub10_T18]
MSRPFLICFILFFNASLFSQECEVLRVGGISGWYPVNYMDEGTNKPKGIAYDFVKVIGKKLNLEVKVYSSYPWKRMLKYVKIGKLDLVTALYWTREREKIYSYTEPYLVNEARVFVLKSKKFKLEKYEDLIGLRGHTPFGGTYGDKFDSFAKTNLNLTHASTKKQHVLLLMKERVDYFILDFQDGMIYLKQNGLENKIIALDYPISTTGVHFAFSKQSPCLKLLDSINQIIIDSKSDGTLDSIIHKYTK